MSDWSIFFAIGAALISIFSILSRAFDKGLSVREHEEFRRGVDQRFRELAEGQILRLPIKNFDDWRDEFRRDIERLEVDLRFLEQTRPTTGELSGTLQAFESRLKLIEARLHDYSSSTPKRST